MKVARSRVQYLSAHCTSSNLLNVLLVLFILVFIFGFPALKSIIGDKVKQAKTVCLNSSKWYTSQENSTDRFCRAGRGRLKDRLNLLREISSVFNSSGTVHWLCYGTLWGVIRSNSLLDYDRDGDICVVNASMSHVARSLLMLKDVYINATYKTFRVWKSLAEVEITLFTYTMIQNPYTDESDVLRLGYDSPFLLDNCYVERFPQRLIKPPLPFAPLNGFLFPVPREHYEIQMYFYPDDWHLIKRPAGCG